MATLATDSALQGVVEIYGTSSEFSVFYLWGGLGLLLTSALCWASTRMRSV